MNRKSIIKVTVLTGQGSSCDFAMNQNKQVQAVNDFRNGTFNLLVATDIAQEGLDVPECNYIIRNNNIVSICKL